MIECLILNPKALGEVFNVCSAEKQTWGDVARANFAFGYGLSVTPLQLARAYAVLANRGQERRVTMLRAAESVAGRQLYRPELVEQLVTMMETVTQTGGTAVRAAIPGYTVAGKTGTVHRLGEHGYEANRYTSLFAGFAQIGRAHV